MRWNRNGAILNSKYKHSIGVLLCAESTRLRNPCSIFSNCRILLLLKFGHVSILSNVPFKNIDSGGGSCSWSRIPMTFSTWWWVLGKSKVALSPSGTKCCTGWVLCPNFGHFSKYFSHFLPFFGIFPALFPKTTCWRSLLSQLRLNFLRLRKKLYLLLFLFSKFLRDLCLFESW